MSKFVVFRTDISFSDEKPISQQSNANVDSNDRIVCPFCWCFFSFRRQNNFQLRKNICVKPASNVNPNAKSANIGRCVLCCVCLSNAIVKHISKHARWQSRRFRSVNNTKAHQYDMAEQMCVKSQMNY